MFSSEQLDHNADWHLVLDFTRGPRVKDLSEAQQRELRLLADGFGDLRGAPEVRINELIWDWSHVRDSSDVAVARMAAYLRGLFPPTCATCGGSGCVYPHPTALVRVPCPDCGVAR